MKRRYEALSAAPVLGIIFWTQVTLVALIFVLPIQAESAKTPLSASINTARPSFSGPATTLETGH